MKLRRFLRTMAFAGAGGAAATALGLPVGWLLGATVATVAAALAGLRSRVPNRLRDAAFFFLGIQAGSGVTPEVLTQVHLWPASFAIQLGGVGLVVALTYVFLKRGFGWDRDTALFASIPGALSFVLAAASETRADMTRIVIVQSVRLLLLIGFLTPTLAWLEGGQGAAPFVLEGGTLFQYAILFSVCALAAVAGAASRMPGGLILGALLASAALHGTGIAPVALPRWLAIPSLIVLGALIGGRIEPESRGALARLAPAALGAFVIGLIGSAIAGALAVIALQIEIGKVALAYAPGALEALTVLAYQFDQDPAYVAAHHVVRFLLLALLVPLVARRLPRRLDEAASEAAHDTESSPRQG
ncbi:AbrB family transcriptional regulator [Aureimonas mangrovi]|uniref:AbrB family transcriptional regulator n=1 Tax=Aureimonas mangrovi TaxID=2758041 RepID=UPI001FE37419|nr:AbrB family transcriptional regulator [Aureimonas mangrovi]